MDKAIIKCIKATYKRHVFEMLVIESFDADPDAVVFIKGAKDVLKRLTIAKERNRNGGRGPGGKNDSVVVSWWF